MANTLSDEAQNKFSPPLTFEEAGSKAEELLSRFTIDQKIELLGGYSRFFIKAFPEHGIPHVFMVDATQGVRITEIDDTSIVKQLEKTTAFPSPILLAATWNPALAREYAKAVGEECRAAGASILLGPGLNIYRISQCGRNFEYFGEDPYLVSRMIENYVPGVQSTGTAATLKHFACNNTDFWRRRSNSIVDERTLNEIYLPGFKAGIDAGAMAVMTAYNKLNGEWCGQSEYVINNLLRNKLGFKWLVMTDWSSVYDGEKVIKSGQDLEMPEREALINAKTLFDNGTVSEVLINRMAESILRTCIAMGFFNNHQDLSFLDKFPEHEQIAFKTAAEGIVLLKNSGRILPILTRKLKIAAVGKYLNEVAHGGGAAFVEGYNNITLAEALQNEFEHVDILKTSDEKKLKSADVVLLSAGTYDYESSDRAFDLPAAESEMIDKVLSLNRNTVVIVNSGAGINMSGFADKAAAIVYAWYGGQTGNKALVQILSGKINPSGRLPITIERKFEDSPGYGYIPEGEKLYDDEGDEKFTHKEYDIEYKEGIFIGYRWYEFKKIKPLFPFGFGLSYSEFKYSNLNVSHKDFTNDDQVEVSFNLENTSPLDGAETPQLYISDPESLHPRPLKELKGFRKVFLKAGEEKEIKFLLNIKDFSYWNPEIRNWTAEPGEFEILIGSSSDKILLKEKIRLV